MSIEKNPFPSHILLCFDPGFWIKKRWGDGIYPESPSVLTINKFINNTCGNW